MTCRFLAASPLQGPYCRCRTERVERQPALQGDATHAVVYLWSMRDNVLTRAARLRSGDRIKVHLFPWDDYSSQYEKFNRSELDDASLQLQDPTWGELMD